MKKRSRLALVVASVAIATTAFVGCATSGADGDGGSSADITPTPLETDAADGGGPEATEEAAGPATGRPCKVALANACPDGFYCGGSSDCANGRCLAVPAEESAVFEPVCGCDDVTYWNESVATRRYRAAKKSDGVCENHRRCDKTTPCDYRQSCVYETYDGFTDLTAREGSACMNPANVGHCWGTPTVCPSEPRAKNCALGPWTATRGGSVPFCTPMCEMMTAGNTNIGYIEITSALYQPGSIYCGCGKQRCIPSSWEPGCGGNDGGCPTDPGLWTDAGPDAFR